MSAVKSVSTLRKLVLTPDRIPSFLIPSRSPLPLLSPRLHRGSPERARLLSDSDDGSPRSGRKSRLGSSASPGFLLRLPSPRVRVPPRAAATAAENADTDLTTRAAMSLPHVDKVTTPYGFRAVLAASPCTSRRESLFHRKKPSTLRVTESDRQDPEDHPPPGPVPARGPSRSRIPRPVKTLGLHVIKELKRPAAALKARHRPPPTSHD